MKPVLRPTGSVGEAPPPTRDTRCPACDGPKPERFELVCERCRGEA